MAEASRLPALSEISLNASTTRLAVKIPFWMLHGTRVVSIILSLAAMAGYVFYECNSYTISILVVDQSGDPVPHAKVEVLRFSIGSGEVRKLDQDGSLKVISFMPAIEQITVTAPGYRSGSYRPTRNDSHTKVFVLTSK